MRQVKRAGTGTKTYGLVKENSYVRGVGLLEASQTWVGATLQGGAPIMA